MGGLEYLQAVQSGAIPAAPLAGPLVIDIAVCDRGRVVVTCTPNGPGDDEAGSIRSGVVCAILDAAAGYAVLSMLAPGQGQSSVEMKVSHFESRCRGDVLTAVGTVKKLGSRVAFAEAVATDAYGDVVATATSSAVIFAVK
jgi:uncharacterized protein (TIGR00369 family)